MLIYLWLILVCYFVYGCAGLKQFKDYVALKDVLLSFVIVGDDCKILFLPISQPVGCFTILLIWSLWTAWIFLIFITIKKMKNTAAWLNMLKLWAWDISNSYYNMINILYRQYWHFETHYESQYGWGGVNFPKRLVTNLKLVEHCHACDY